MNSSLLLLKLPSLPLSKYLDLIFRPLNFSSHVHIEPNAATIFLCNKRSPIPEQENELLMDRWSRMKRAVSITSVKDLNNIIMGKMPRNKTSDGTVFKRRDETPPPPSSAITRLPITKSPIGTSDRRPVSALRVVNEDEEVSAAEHNRVVMTSRGELGNCS